MATTIQISDKVKRFLDKFRIMNRESYNDVIEFMSDSSSIPILLDGDTGYGNFYNMRRLVKKLEQREVAGVCIEDKLFPKTNSFIS